MPPRLRTWIRHLAPASQAFVMATGIVSVGLHLEGLAPASQLLLGLAAGGYVLLVAVSVVRLVVDRSEMRADLSDPGRAFGFFIFVAGTNVLGTRLAADGHVALPLGLLGVSTLAWVVLGYLVPWRVVLDARGDDLTRRVDGSWFVWVVASQSVTVLAATLEDRVADGAGNALAILAVLGWGTGLGLYLVMGTALAIRVLRHGISAEELSPAFWVVMGALAISVLAASRLVTMGAYPIGEAVHGLAAGLAIALWAFAAWLLLPLALLGWWRHVRERVPLRYSTAQWAGVFPWGCSPSPASASAPPTPFP